MNLNVLQGFPSNYNRFQLEFLIYAMFYKISRLFSFNAINLHVMIEYIQMQLADNIVKLKIFLIKSNINPCQKYLIFSQIYAQIDTQSMILTSN